MRIGNRGKSNARPMLEVDLAPQKLSTRRNPLRNRFDRLKILSAPGMRQ
jgi:hypothetical protein